MSGPLLGLVALVYAYCALQYWWDGRPGMSLAFLAYSAATVGFILDLKR